MSPAAIFEQPLPGISPDIYGPDDFRAVSELIYAVSGNVLPEGKAMLVYSRLAPRVRETGSGTFSAYIERIREPGAEQDRAVAALTTNHTYFNREAHHFDHFERQVRPVLLRSINAGRPVRIWSAGCSSGEETWSLVMTLLGSDRAEGRRLAASDLRVLATDLDPDVLARARTANYPAKDIAAMPSDLVQQWATIDGDTATISEIARAIVRFRLLNLLGNWPMRGKFDVIFCRNVMIYFDQPTKERLIARFAEKLEPGAHLYIGHSERVTGTAAAQFEAVGPTIYRRRAA
jgi:chemotaxis protein methyltransferase CheR